MSGVVHLVGHRQAGHVQAPGRDAGGQAGRRLQCVVTRVRSAQAEVAQRHGLASADVLVFELAGACIQAHQISGDLIDAAAAAEAGILSGVVHLVGHRQAGHVQAQSRDVYGQARCA